jgi:hypothetical protein
MQRKEQRVLLTAGLDLNDKILDLVEKRSWERQCVFINNIWPEGRLWRFKNVVANPFTLLP